MTRKPGPEIFGHLAADRGISIDDLRVELRDASHEAAVLFDVGFGPGIALRSEQGFFVGKMHMDILHELIGHLAQPPAIRLHLPRLIELVDQGEKRLVLFVELGIAHSEGGHPFEPGHLDTSEKSCHSRPVEEISGFDPVEGARSPGRALTTDPRLSGVELKFPVSFDLRIIYVKAEGPDIVADLEGIYKARGVGCSLIQGADIPGSKYARMGSRLTFANREQMYGTYEDIGKLSYVKSAI